MAHVVLEQGGIESVVGRNEKLSDRRKGVETTMSVPDCSRILSCRSIGCLSLLAVGLFASFFGVRLISSLRRLDQRSMKGSESLDPGRESPAENPEFSRFKGRIALVVAFFTPSCCPIFFAICIFVLALTSIFNSSSFNVLFLATRLGFYALDRNRSRFAPLLYS